MGKRRGKEKEQAQGDDKNEDNEKKLKKKRGQASDFKGARLEFLTSKIPEYLAAGKRRGKEVKTDGFPVFWPQLFAEYWRRFPWDLPLDKEPDPGTGEGEEPAPNTPDDVFEALGLNMTEEEQEKRGKIQTELKAKVKRWFGRQRPAAMGIHGNPFFKQLARLRREESESPPKRATDFRFYMRHPDYKEAVAARFEEKYGDEPKAKHIALRCLVAQEMLAAESDDVKTRVKEECDAEHELEMEAYKDSEEGMPSPDADVQRECRENFLSIVQPLLAGLHAYTGLTLNIMGGHINPETKQFEIRLAKIMIIFYYIPL
ncbi:hypothetical protein K438DRAFT_1766448 [Mycena galopus ATCC 62051]|nr:hypothetical protein K438DRAFT_1766448 [Mycena galopus ATCC 62051]